jgi:methyl-accepting chemotaxis protein
VVAEEIRKLADQSDEASRRIRETIENLLSDFAGVVRSMQQMREVIDQQNSHIRSTETTVKDVVDGLGHTAQGIGTILGEMERLEAARGDVDGVIASLAGSPRRTRAASRARRRRCARSPTVLRR